VVHYSLVVSYDTYISPQARQRIRDFPGFKAAFVQDDYRWINDTVDALAFMKINALFPLVGAEIMDLVYSPDRLPNVRRHTVLTGYVPEELTRRLVPPFAARPMDVGYRARKLPAWIGSHVLQKWQIADRFRADAPKYGLKVDLSYHERDRMYGEAWVRFMTRCKAVLGTESGASVCDFTGDIQRQVEAHLSRDPSASFETLRSLYFEQEDGRIMMNVISPRCFEAASLRTLMILYEGEYSGILKPWRHYVPLAQDHSNMDHIVEILRDPVAAQRIVDAAYQEVALNPAYTFRAMVGLVDQVMAEGFVESMAATKFGYTEAEFNWRTHGAERDVSWLLKVSAPTGIASQAVLGDLLVDRPGKVPVTSQPDRSLPHKLQISCPSGIKVLGIHLHWATPQSAASEGEVFLLRRNRILGAVRFGSATPAYYSYIPLSPDLRKADTIEIVFAKYHGETKMQLMDVRVDSSTLPLSERLRRLRRRLGGIVLYRLTNVWMALPMAVRSRMRRFARSAFETVFGRL